MAYHVQIFWDSLVWKSEIENKQETTHMILNNDPKTGAVLICG